MAYDPRTQTYSTRLANGARIVSQPRPHGQSAAIGIWLQDGSRHEQPAQAGYAHLLEHLFFKGSRRHDRRQIARLSELWGGQVNAHTGREHTALHGLVPAPNATELAGLLTEMLLNPSFDQADLDSERGVVLQELAAVDDLPEEAIEEAALRQAWPEHPLGAPILGRAANLRRCRLQDLRDYHQGRLQGDKVVLAAVGAVTHDELLAHCQPLLEALPGGAPAALTAPRFCTTTMSRRHDSGQTHLIWAVPAPALTAPAFPAAVLANQILGGGVASWLFQELREHHGLVYDVRSWLEPYADCGLWLIQTACDPEHGAECARLVAATLRRLAQGGPGAEELADAAAHLRAALLLETDELEPSMERLARETIYLGRPLSLEERLAPLEQVTLTQVRRQFAVWGEPLHLCWEGEPQA